MIGKEIRMERIIDRETGKTIIVPLDHGVSVGPIPGLTDIKQSISNVVNGGATAIIIHKGLVEKGHRKGGRDVGLIVHMSASTCLSPAPNAKTLVCTVEEAIQLGADAVSIHVNMGDITEKEMLRDFGCVSKSAMEWGIPLIAMMYPRGEKIKNEYDVEPIKHAARVAAELGADLVKVSYTGTPESFREVVEGCHVPVVIAGGEKKDTDEGFLEMVRGSIDAGGKGVSIGRNIFQHKDPGLMISAIGKIVFEDKSVEEAIRVLKEG